MKTLQRYMFRFGAISVVAYFPIVETVTHFANSHYGFATCECIQWVVVSTLAACLVVSAAAFILALSFVPCAVEWLWKQLVAVDRSLR